MNAQYVFLNDKTRGRKRYAATNILGCIGSIVFDFRVMRAYKITGMYWRDDAELSYFDSFKEINDNLVWEDSEENLPKDIVTLFFRRKSNRKQS